jgi:hypothetical protein
MAVMINKHNNKDLKEFTKHCEYYLSILHLGNWDVAFQLGEEGSDANARCQYDVTAQKAVMILSEDHEHPVPIKDLAKHECLELLLADMATKLASYYSDLVIDRASHRVINRLMKVIY